MCFPNAPQYLVLPDPIFGSKKFQFFLTVGCVLPYLAPKGSLCFYVYDLHLYISNSCLFEGLFIL